MRRRKEGDLENLKTIYYGAEWIEQQICHTEKGGQ